MLSWPTGLGNERGGKLVLRLRLEIDPTNVYRTKHSNWTERQEGFDEVSDPHNVMREW